jgi:uncharacterized membrane protein
MVICPGNDSTDLGVGEAEGTAAGAATGGVSTGVVETAFTSTRKNR